MNLEDFILGLHKLGSQSSQLANTFIFKGVNGLTFTQQVAIGSALRNGISTDEIDMEELKFTVHGRLALSGIQIEGGLKVRKDKIAEFGITSIFAQYQFKELYLDWKAGFEAAEHYQVFT